MLVKSSCVGNKKHPQCAILNKMKDDIFHIDLHGLNMSESKRVLDEIFEWLKVEGKHVKKLEIEVGMGNRSAMGPVLPSLVINYLKDKDLIGEFFEGIVKVNLNTEKPKS